jgi:GDP-mannose pyrophosphatase NudK
MMNKPQMILVAGPYRSGTNDDPALIQKNVDFMNEIALQVYRMGHLPVLGEWYALPLIETAGGKALGDEVFTEIFHPVAVRLIDFCTAVLRVGGASQGADEMVTTGIQQGKIIYRSLSEIPKV